MTDALSKSAAFVRGFFQFLDGRGVSSAVLHGGEDGFENVLSDVDIVVERGAFPRLPKLIDEYCRECGWQLCQILRHETTAAFFVCSAEGDPARVVALDVCSDYQRNGTQFLSAEQLLINRRTFTWGGHGLDPATELRYRLTKAAAKNKDAVTCETEFAAYPEEIRRECAAWLDEVWGIPLISWDAAGLAVVFSLLRANSNLRPSLLQAGALKRILPRILSPTGLVVIAGHTDFEATAARLESVFAHLYFRRTRKAARWQPAMIKDLIASTLVVIPELSFVWSKLIPPGCLLHLDPGANVDRQHKAIAAHLRQRCAEREKP